MSQESHAHLKAVRMAREVMLLPCRLEQPHKSRDSSLERQDKGVRSTALRMPWQCCTLKLISPERQLRGCSLQRSQSFLSIVADNFY